MGESRVVYRVLVVQPVERDHLENPGVYGGKILRSIFTKWDVGGTDCIDLVQDMDRWHTLMNAIMNFLVP
jgi:hypothetical protein